VSEGTGPGTGSGTGSGTGMDWWVNPDADSTVDATGLRCPLPVIRLATAARDCPPGHVIMLLSTDPAAGPDVAAWCRMRGHALIDQQDHGPVLASRVRVSGTPAGEERSVPAPAGGGTPAG
jgi:tRNA 2-thiouridine synthesizing protein A